MGGSGCGRAVHENSTVWLQMQRKRWLGHAVDEHVVGCWGQMAAECVVGVIVLCSMSAVGVIVVCTPIVCMPDVMHVWQQVAALGSSSRQMRAGLGDAAVALSG